MASRYIPPALRNKTAAQEEPPTKTYDLRDIAKFFGHHDIPESHGPSTQSQNDPGHNDIAAEKTQTDTKAGPESGNISTLNVNKHGDRDKLAFILLYRFAHPFWDSKKEIFCKTNLDLLKDLPAVTSPSGKEGDAETTTTSHSASYPVFIQADHRAKSTFKLDGFYNVQSIRYLEPRSDELIAYLEAKFRNKNRNAKAWKASLSTIWAVLTMEHDGSRDDGDVDIPTAKVEKRGVNEVLAEMRIGRSEGR